MTRTVDFLQGTIIIIADNMHSAVEIINKELIDNKITESCTEIGYIEELEINNCRLIYVDIEGC